MLRFITDSAADLPQGIIDEYQIEVLPTPIDIDDKRYFDGRNLSTDQLYQIMGESGHSIRTHHVTPEMFEDAFLPHVAINDSIICLCFSEGIAGGYDAAKIARISVMEQYPNADIIVLNTKCASAGFGLLVYKLAMMYRNGASRETLLKAAGFYSEHIRHTFTITKLHYFMKGGRIMKLLGSIGDTLELKPIFNINEEGALQLLKAVRGNKKAIGTMVDLVYGDGASFPEQTLAYCYGDEREALDFTMQLANEAIHPKSVLVSDIGCAVAAHTGKGMIGICYLNTPDIEYQQFLA